MLTNTLQELILANPGECLNNSKTKVRFDHLFAYSTHLKYITGFIQELVVETDELGIAKTRPKKKSIPKQTKKRRNNIQKSQYHFNKTTTKSLEYRNYFDPSLQVENKLLGIAEIVSKSKSVKPHSHSELPRWLSIKLASRIWGMKTKFLSCPNRQSPTHSPQVSLKRKLTWRWTPSPRWSPLAVTNARPLVIKRTPWLKRRSRYQLRRAWTLQSSQLIVQQLLPKGFF